jgi:4-amino-4-deoxy-L-arabinose transferase-like glycosyltransferase
MRIWKTNVDPMTRSRFLRSFNFTLAFSIVLALFEAIVIYLVLSRDTRPPAWDPSTHLYIALDYYFPLHSFQIDRFLKQILFAPKPFPPLFHVSLATEFLFTGVSHQYAAMANCFFLLVIYLSFYLLGRKFQIQDEIPFSILLFSSFPIVQWITRSVLIDMSLIAVTFLFAAMLYDRNVFLDPKAARWAGLAFSLGFLTKQSFIFFALPMLLYLFLRNRQQLFDRSFLRGVFIFLKWASISLAWYLLHIISVMKKALEVTRWGVAAGQPNPFSLASITYYLRAFYEVQANTGVLFLLAVAILLVWKNWSEPQKFLVVWIIGGYLCLTFLMRTKDPRYSAPLLPAIILLATLGLSRFPRFVRVSIVALSLLLYGGTVGYLFGVFNSSAFARSLLEKPQAQKLFQSSGIALNEFLPKSEDWKVTDCIDAIIAKRGKQAKIFIGVLPSSQFFNHGTFLYFAKAKRTSFEIREFSAVTDPEAALNGLDYLVTKTGDQGPPFVTVHNAEVLNEVHSTGSAWETVFTASLPDQSILQMLEHIPRRPLG